MIKNNLYFLAILFFALCGKSQITTTVNPTIAQMTQLLQGNGVVITGLTLTCPAGAYASFGNATPVFGAGLSSGILLTTGDASIVTPSLFDNSIDNAAPGSALGDLLDNSGLGTFDGCYMTFLITPSCNTLSVNYVFASEEYNTFVGSINDVFGFVLDGPNPLGGNYAQTNIATVPGTGLPVSIGNVNNGNSTPATGPCMNCAYFIDAPPNLIYNGSTTVLTASTLVTPCQTYTMTIGIWDVADGVLDSGVFLDVNGLSCVGSPTLTTVTSPSVICGPQTVTLTAGGGIASGSYTWTAPASGGLVTTLGQTVTANPTSATTYTLLYSDINTCPGVPLVQTTAITFSPLPAFSITQNPVGPICLGQTATLTANGVGGTFSWLPAATLSSPTGITVVSTPVTNTTYTVLQTIGTCTSSAAISVTVASAAPIAVTPSSTIICLGQSASLSSSGSGPFAWTASTGANPPNTAIVSVSPLVTTTYTVVSGVGTCTSSAVSTVSVSPAFSLTATPSSTLICAGSSANLSVSGGATYTWSPAGSLNISSGANVISTPTTSTTFTISGSNGICTTTTTASVNVTVINATVTASSLNYCIGASPVTLTGSGGTTYSWSPATGLSSAIGAIVTATPAITTVYSLTATSAGNCSSVKTITITVPATTTVTAFSTNTLICAGGSGTTLSANGVNTFTWLPGPVNTSTLLANPLTTTTYTVGGQTALGCIAIPALITVSVAPSVTPTLSASSTTVCLTKTISISALPTGAGISYTWAPSSAIVGAVNSSSIIAKPITAANVIYTLTLSNGICVSSQTISIQVFTCIPPVVGFNTLTNDTICTKGCVSFTSTTTGDAPITYQWLCAGSTPSTSALSNPQFCFNAPGNFTVGLIATNAYGSDTLIKPNYIFVADTPNVVRAFGDTLIKIGLTAPISVIGGTTYYWTPDNGTIACPTCSNTIVQPTVTTQYIVTAYNTIYCHRSDTVTVKVDFTCGDFFVPNVFSPNGDGLNDYVNVYGFCISTFHMRIYSRWGEKVFESTEKAYGWDGTYKGKTMDTGVFVYEVDGITIEGKEFTVKGNVTLLR